MPNEAGKIEQGCQMCLHPKLIKLLVDCLEREEVSNAACLGVEVTGSDSTLPHPGIMDVVDDTHPVCKRATVCVCSHTPTMNCSHWLNIVLVECSLKKKEV